VTTQTKIDVMQAAVHGKPIERRTRNCNTDAANPWLPAEYPVWDWATWEYRVAEPPQPPPISGWVNVYNFENTNGPYATPEAAKEWAAPGCRRQAYVVERTALARFTGWINLYHDGTTGSRWYPTARTAAENARPGCITQVYVAETTPPLEQVP
jgi:hypothetical protein